MHREPELLVPLSEVHQVVAEPAYPRWAVILTRLWIVVSVLLMLFVLATAGWRPMLYTFAFCAIAWNVVAWICGVDLSRLDGRR